MCKSCSTSFVSSASDRRLTWPAVATPTLRYNCDMKAGHLEFDPETLRHFCEKWGVAELAVFGSVLRDDFRPDSDIDFLVTWARGVQRTWRDIWAMKQELETLYHREVGLAQRQVVEADQNEFRRASILNSARTLIAAA